MFILQLLHFLREDSLYWADVDRKLIMRSSLDGSNPTTMVDTAIERPGNNKNKVYIIGLKPACRNCIYCNYYSFEYRPLHNYYYYKKFVILYHE